MKVSRQRMELTKEERILLKIPECITRFNDKSKVYTLEEAINDYVLFGPYKKNLEKIYNAATKMFKETKKLVIKGKKYSLVCKRSNSSHFDKEAFIKDHGQLMYDKYCKAVTKYEWVVAETNVLEAAFEEEEE